MLRPLMIPLLGLGLLGWLPATAPENRRVVIWSGGWGWKRGPMWIYAPAIDTLVEGFEAAADAAAPLNNVTVTKGVGEWPRFEREVARARVGDVFVYIGIVDLKASVAMKARHERLHEPHREVHASLISSPEPRYHCRRSLPSCTSLAVRTLTL